MSKAEILAELPDLHAEERQEVLHRLYQLQEEDLLHGAEPSREEKAILDEALKEFHADRDPGSPWREVLGRIRDRLS